MTKSVFTGRYQSFLAMLIKTRKEKGLTQSDIGKRLKKPQSFVCKYEKGERRLDIVEFLDIADALGIDPAGFITDLKSEI